jgi:hypothetical protein
MAGPSKLAEACVAVLLPPACREEVLGDLHERYESPGRYALDALSAVPLVVLSRIRRTTDAQVLLMQAVALYLSFMSAGWWRGEFALARLAIPAAAALLGIVLDEAYARPGRRSLPGLAPWPLAGAFLVLLSQILFRVDGWVLILGCGVGLPLASLVKILFSSPEKFAGLARFYQRSKEGWTVMNWKIVLAIATALLVGFTAGMFAGPNHLDVGRRYLNAMPFLLLVTFWLGLMVHKFSKPSR